MKGLHLDENKIGDMGAEKLAEALPGLANLAETWLESFFGTQKKGYIKCCTPLHTNGHMFRCMCWGPVHEGLSPFMHPCGQTRPMGV